MNRTHPGASSRTIRSMLHLVVLMLAMLGWSATAQAQSTCAAATSQGTAPSSWQTYCWLNFAAYNDTTARGSGGQNFSYTLSDGATLTFNLRVTGAAVGANASPSWTGSAVGNVAFLGIPGSPIMYQRTAGTTTLTISNILISPAPGVPAVSAYAFVAADAESSNDGESLQFVTNGSGWQVLDEVYQSGSTAMPTSSGTNTSTFTVGGVGGTVGGHIIGSQSPTTVTTTLVGGGLQGVMFAVRFASVRLAKRIVGTRLNAADQFRFDIRATANGTVLGTGTTSGTGLGPFNANAVSLASGVPLTIVETMAPGSVSTLAAYDSRLTCVNGATGSSTVLPNNAAVTTFNFGTLEFGDAIQCTFTNTPRPHISLRKLLGSGGRRFAADQFTLRIQQGATIVAQTTTTGTSATITNGTIGLTQVTAGTATSLLEVAAGSADLAQYIATMSCTNANPSSTTTLPTTVPGPITPVLGDVVTCTITNTRRNNNATLSIEKTSSAFSDPFNGTVNPKQIPGSTVRYSIRVANSGNLAVDANTVLVIDRLPAGLWFDNSVPVSFADGTPASGLTFSAATAVRFSNSVTPPASFAACTYVPASGIVDPNVRHICIRPSGTMLAASSSGQPNFTVAFNAQVQ